LDVRAAFEHCQLKLADYFHEFLLVRQEEINLLSNELEELYKTVTTLPGTRGYHCFISIDSVYIKTKVYSSSMEEKIHKFGAAKIVSNETAGTSLPIIPHHNVVAEVIDTNYSIGSYIPFKALNVARLGMVTENNLEELFLEVVPLTRLGTGNSWQFSYSGSEVYLAVDDTLCKISAPTTTNGRIYKLDNNDFSAVKERSQIRRQNK